MDNEKTRPEWVPKGGGKEFTTTVVKGKKACMMVCRVVLPES